MSFTRRFRTNILLIAGLFGTSAAAAQSASDVVAESIAAAGGERRLARIENVTRSGRISIESPFLGKLEGTLHVVQLPGRAYHESVNLGVVTQRKGWDGTRAWEQGPNGLRLLEGEEARVLAQQSFVNPLVGMRELARGELRLERLGDAEVQGRPQHAIAVTNEGAPPSTLYIDHETRLLSRTETTTAIPGLGDAKTVVEVGEYVAYRRVLMPSTLRIEVEGISTTQVTFDRTEVDTAVDESIFAVPAEADAAQPAAAAGAAAGSTAAQADPFGGPFKEHCAVCHGENLEGAAQGTPLAGALVHGDSVDALSRSIAAGLPQQGMPAWADTLDATAIRRLAIFIAERRAELSYSDFAVATPPSLPSGLVASEAHAFRVEVVAQGIDALPYAIAPLPDGRILVTEKTRGLRIVSPTGELSEPVRGTPGVFDDGFEMPGIRLVYGQGYLLDLALHPGYAQNGWIYLSHTERCTGCNAQSRETGRPVSMVKLVRGRIADGAWIDEETIWRAGEQHYTTTPDLAAGGRIAFDGAGHVFLTIGIKGGSEIDGVQDLSRPYGKVHRVAGDGSIPTDNPFVNVPNALPSIWTYGHRSPQGLELDLTTGRLWGTEMGQRGGDEVNLLLPGRNYGWPLQSRGVQYDGKPVDFAAELGIDVDLSTLEQPRVDLTPSPAVSSFVVYDGAAFPAWRGNLLVGTLKATELYRMVVDGERVTHVETLVGGMGRIRDIETDARGRVYLLLEHASGSRIVRLVPAR